MRYIAICTLLLAAPAAAEFTAQEKAQIQAQVESLYDSGRTYASIREQLVVRPQDALQVATLFGQISLAHERHIRGLLYLLDQEGGDSVTIDGMTRVQAVAAGVNGILEQSASYAPAIATIDSMVLTPSLSVARQLLAGAEAKRLALNRGLAYNEPRVAGNMAMFGATRLKSANAGPHGDYRRFGELIRVFEVQSGRWIRAAAAMATQNPSSISTFHFVTEKMNRVQAFTPALAGLVAGVEHPEFSGDIDVMTAGGTTQRSRHFFRVQMALEIILGWDHGVESHPFGQDVFGRTVVRGLTYELTAACRSMSDFILGDATLPAYARSAITANKEICESWSSLDGLAQNLLVLRYFTNLGPPGQVVGVCGVNTTLQLGQPPTCVASGVGSGLTCGTGTHEESGVCVADPCPDCPPPPVCPECPPPTTCPTFTASATLEPIPGTGAFAFVPLCLAQ